MMNIINNSNLVNFNYFLALSSSHVFKKIRINYMKIHLKNLIIYMV